MIIGDVRIRNISARINEDERIAIESYIKEAVFKWCNDHRSKWFAVRDLFGGENRFWNGTPLFAIYEWYRNNGTEEPEIRAGRDVGHFLKTVLHNDQSTRFNYKRKFVNQYQWVEDL